MALLGAHMLRHALIFFLWPLEALTIVPIYCWQAGAGLVADSVPEMEYEECVNKAAALGRAIDLAEQAFL